MSTPQNLFSSSVSNAVDKILSKRVLKNLSAEEREEFQEDIQVARRLLGEQRTPRIALIGPEDVSVPSVVKSILGESLEGDPTVKEHLGRGRWYEYACKRGELRLLDLRSAAGGDIPTQAIEREQPDLILFIWPHRDDESNELLVSALEKVVEQSKRAWGDTPMTVAAIEPAESDGSADFDPGAAESALRRLLVASTVPNESFDVVLRRDEARAVELMIRRAPLEVRVRLAHLTWVREVKREVAESVVRAASGIAGVVASVPVPVADILPLTGLQMAMITSVAHISGRQLELRHAVEFVLAMGANVGLGFVFRQIARATARLLPVAGSVISAGIASSATYALGKAAIAYFIGERRS
ncbi:MAG: hypothetical protein ACOC9W_05595 [Persicimonas sp.]